MTVADIADAFDPGMWQFTPEVVQVFDEHVRASVPFYDAIQDAVAEMADWLAPDGAHVVDLGASTGETLLRIAERHPERTYRLTAYDESGEMLSALAQKLKPRQPECYVQRIQNGLRHQPATLTLALFTLQFLPPEHRVTVLRMAHNLSTPDGALIIAEKVRVADSRWAEIAAEVSWDYKAERGITSDSVRAKARALRGVLRPWSERQTLDAMTEAGWHRPTTLFQWHQWALYGAFANA